MIKLNVNYDRKTFEIDGGRCNPLPDEVQRVVIEKIAKDVVNEYNRIIKGEQPEESPGLRQLLSPS